MNAESRLAYYSDPETRIRDVLTTAPTIPQRLAMFYEEHIAEIALIGFAGGTVLTLGVSLNQPVMAAIGVSALIADVVAVVPTAGCYIAETT